MPHYRRAGKQLTPISEQQFIDGMEHGNFAKPQHRAFPPVLYYYTVRLWEALRSKKEQFSLQDNRLYFEVGKRLKHGITTPPLAVSIKRPYVDLIWKAVEDTKPKKRVFPYCPKTGYNIISRVWTYPHHFRLTGITHFFNAGFKIPQVRTWTGLTLEALNFYIGKGEIEEMGEAPIHPKSQAGFTNHIGP